VNISLTFLAQSTRHRNTCCRLSTLFTYNILH